MKKHCTDKIFKISRYFHILSIMVIMAGTGINMYASFNHQYTGFWLPLALSIMILLRLPNQVCVAHEHSDGWLSVIGSIIGMIGFIATVIIIVSTHHSNTGGDEESVEDKSNLLGLSYN